MGMERGCGWKRQMLGGLAIAERLARCVCKFSEEKLGDIRYSAVTYISRSSSWSNSLVSYFTTRLLFLGYRIAYLSITLPGYIPFLFCLNDFPI